MTNAEQFVKKHQQMHLWMQTITNRIKQEELLEANQPTETSVSTTPTTPSNEITVRILNKYGNDLIYPADHKAHIFADMLGQKTFTRTNIKYIKSLGFTVKQTFEEVNL
jgi:hypothetical protein